MNWKSRGYGAPVDAPSRDIAGRRCEGTSHSAVRVNYGNVHKALRLCSLLGLYFAVALSTVATAKSTVQTSMHEAPPVKGELSFANEGTVQDWMVLKYRNAARKRNPPEPRKRREYWYWTATPPANGASPIFIGPYGTLMGCRDMLGSALYSHPFACHLTGPHPPANCRITGNGFAYPKNYPYPVPSDMYIPSVDCIESDDPSLRLRRGWYFLYYTVNGGGVAVCREYRKYRELAEMTPGMEVGNYSEMHCPGAPCFSVGMDTACN